MDEWLQLAFLFVMVTGLTLSAVVWFIQRKDEQEARLQQLEDPPFRSQATDSVLGSWTEPLAQQSPMDKAKQNALEQELREAGYYKPTAVTEYAAIRAALILCPLCVAGVLSVMVEPQYLLHVIGGGILAAALGFSVPRLVINMQAKRRSQEIESGLPTAIDLLSLCLTGGQNIFHALARVQKELAHAYPVLAGELKIVHQQAELANLELALHQFANRTNVQEVKNLAVILSQSERLGTDIASSLMEFSNNLRVTIRQRADSYANRASFWMVFPSIFCLWLPALVLLMSPAYFEFQKTRRDTQRLQDQSFESVKEFNRLTAPNKK